MPGSRLCGFYFCTAGGTRQDTQAAAQPLYTQSRQQRPQCNTRACMPPLILLQSPLSPGHLDQQRQRHHGVAWRVHGSGSDFNCLSLGTYGRLLGVYQLCKPQLCLQRPSGRQVGMQHASLLGAQSHSSLTSLRAKGRRGQLDTCEQCMRCCGSACPRSLLKQHAHVHQSGGQHGSVLLMCASSCYSHVTC